MAERRAPAQKYTVVPEEEAQRIRETARTRGVSQEVQELREEVSGMPRNQVIRYPIPDGKNARGWGRSLSVAARHNQATYVPYKVEDNDLLFELTPGVKPKQPRTKKAEQDQEEAALEQEEA